MIGFLCDGIGKTLIFSSVGSSLCIPNPVPTAHSSETSNGAVAQKATSYTTLGIVRRLADCSAFATSPIVDPRPNGVSSLATRWQGTETSGLARSVSERTWLPVFWWLCVGDLRVCRFYHCPVRQPAYSYHPFVWRQLSGRSSTYNW
jgi:hypothetical protein